MCYFNPAFNDIVLAIFLKTNMIKNDSMFFIKIKKPCLIAYIIKLEKADRHRPIHVHFKIKTATSPYLLISAS